MGLPLGKVTRQLGNLLFLCLGESNRKVKKRKEVALVRSLWNLIASDSHPAALEG
jgi:hypothetical protein